MLRIHREQFGRWLAFAGLVGLASCGREAELVVVFDKGTFVGDARLYVCGANASDPCKPADVFPAGSPATHIEVGVFVEDGSEMLDLNLQLGGGAALCRHFVVNVNADSEIAIQLTSVSGQEIKVSNCTSCTVLNDTCTYAGRDS